jgi:hypothetical protein
MYNKMTQSQRQSIASLKTYISPDVYDVLVEMDNNELGTSILSELFTLQSRVQDVAKIEDPKERENASMSVFSLGEDNVVESVAFGLMFSTLVLHMKRDSLMSANRLERLLCEYCVSKYQILKNKKPIASESDPTEMAREQTASMENNDDPFGGGSSALAEPKESNAGFILTASPAPRPK